MKVRTLGTLIALFTISAGIVGKPALASPPPGKGYVPVFDDEFTGTSLNTSWWNYNYPWGTYHNGEANMNPSEVFVNNGLTLQAEDRRSIWNPWGIWSNTFNKYIPFDYTSGTINTDGKESWHYGYFEGRFKMPPATSTWPAFWMLQDGGWPPELDIFELAGSRSDDHYTYHYSGASGPLSFGSDFTTGGNLSQGWHNYGFEWTPNHLNYYVDDKLIKSFYDPADIAQMKNMYFLIDLQVGGWAPDPVASDYPQQLKCQWVKVWQIGGPPSGNYRLAPVSDPGKSLDVLNYSQKAGTQLDIYPADYSENEIFNLQRQTNGSYAIKAYPDWNWDNLFLDVPGWNTNNGNPMDIWTGGPGGNQLYYFNDEGNHNWWISPAIATSKAVEVAYNLGKVDLWSFWGGTNQLWLLDPPLGAMSLNAVGSSSVTDTAATINWKSSYPATSEVDYGTTTNYSNQITDPSTLQNHALTLTGLKPGMEYHYRVVSTDMYGEKISSSDHTFSTQWSNLPRLEVSSTNVTRLSDNDIQVKVGLTNVGTAAAQNVDILNSSLGGNAPVSIAPSGPYNVAVGQSVALTLVFPQMTSKTSTVLVMHLHSSNGLEGIGARVTIP